MFSSDDEMDLLFEEGSADQKLNQTFEIRSKQQKLLCELHYLSDFFRFFKGKEKSCFISLTKRGNAHFIEGQELTIGNGVFRLNGFKPNQRKQVFLRIAVSFLLGIFNNCDKISSIVLKEENEIQIFCNICEESLRKEIYDSIWICLQGLEEASLSLNFKRYWKSSSENKKQQRGVLPYATQQDVETVVVLPNGSTVSYNATEQQQFMIEYYKYLHESLTLIEDIEEEEEEQEFWPKDASPPSIAKWIIDSV